MEIRIDRDANRVTYCIWIYPFGNTYRGNCMMYTAFELTKNREVEIRSNMHLYNFNAVTPEMFQKLQMAIAKMGELIARAREEYRDMYNIHQFIITPAEKFA